MDIISHALWGGVAFGRTNRARFLAAGSVSILPDLLTEGLFGVLLFLGIGNMPGWENGHPNITDYPLFAQNLYSLTHSLLIFAVVFGIAFLIYKKPIWPLAGWGLHILIDIPTHSRALFPTPFLWPISSFTFDGIPWHTPIILTLDVILLGLACILWLYPRFRKNRPV
ncbi:MAG: hypothetical protein R3F48_00395 [Candidatus Zixiibacteriota bacterium]